MFRMIFFLLSLSVMVANAQNGTITDIQVTGNTKTKTAFVIKLLNVKVGDPLDSIAVQADANRLIRLPAVANANYKTELIAEGLIG